LPWTWFGCRKQITGRTIRLQFRNERKTVAFGMLYGKITRGLAA
jgi:hypothetical protein